MRRAIVAAALVTGLNLALSVTAAEAGSSKASRACTELSKPADLDLIRGDLSGRFCLAKDIDLAAISAFVPIGTKANAFKGTLDGRGHVISGLTMERSDSSGLFVAVAGKVKDLGLVDVNVFTASKGHVGALAAQLEKGGVVDNVFSTGNVGKGIYGSVGGLVGFAKRGSLIRNSTSAASVSRGPTGSAGGLVGLLSRGARVIDSSASGDVDGVAGSSVGGLAGYSQGAIERSFAIGPVSTSAGSAGGLVGLNQGVLRYVYARGSVTGGNNSAIGGLVGSFFPEDGSDAPLEITQAYAVGQVSGAEQGAEGGLIGSAEDTSAVTASYWDKQTTGQSKSAGGKGLNTADFVADLPKGFDPDIWVIKPNKPYPRLR